MKFVTCLFIFILFGRYSYASQFAVVISSKAIIYADPTLKIPIGYITKGKEIIVGDLVKGRKNKIIPTIITGKIAYIEISHLQLENEIILQGPSEKPQKIALLMRGKGRKSARSMKSKTKSQSLSKNKEKLKKESKEKSRSIREIWESLEKKVGFGYKLFHPGSAWQELSDQLGGPKSSFNGHLIQGFYEIKLTNDWRSNAGLNYFLISEDKLSLHAIGTELGILYTFPFKNFIPMLPGNYQLEMAGHILYYPYAKVGFLNKTMSGGMFGWQLGTQLHHSLNSHWDLNYGLGLYSLSSGGLADDINTQNKNILSISEFSLQGLQLFINTTYHF